MKKVSKQDILDIINQIDDEMMDNGDDSMSVYDCFDFYEEDNKKIAKCLLNAITDKSHTNKLYSLYNVVVYCGVVLPEMIMERLYCQKKINKRKYNSLLKWLKDAWAYYHAHNCRLTQKKLEEYLVISNYSITKTKIKEMIDVLYGE